MHCKVTQVLRDLVSINQWNGSEMTYVAVATKANLKNWTPSYDWMTWCRQQSEDINYIVMEDLNLYQFWQKSYLNL